ncbi:MAG TPA: lactate 2-monooxygenase [Gemmatimonadaceae bacterium]|nr:lactate 2-monooxygenase [Gemmatimonadaceae bacterium]
MISPFDDIPPGPGRQRSIYVDGIGGIRPAVPTRAAHLARKAMEAMSPQAWAYIAGGAGAEGTVRANRRAFDKRQIIPRVLRGVSQRDLSIDLLGTRRDHPLFLAPIGVLDIAHPEGDLAVARAAAAEGVPMIISSQASASMEDIARAAGNAPRWFQLYWSTSNDLVASFVRRAEACGCEAIVLTLDTTMLGWRTRDLDLGSLPFLEGMGIAQYTSDPVFRASLEEPVQGNAARPKVNLSSIGALARIRRRARDTGLSLGEMRRAIQRFAATYSRPSLAWEDLAHLRSITTLPIVLKGIQHPDDAQRAIEAGVNAIIVSNHGGRQLDGAIGSLDALPSVVAAVKGQMPVLFDSGIRGGADIFKALALGAKAVLIGRPYVYGLSIAGEQGVRDVIRNMLAELDLTLGLAGYDSVKKLTTDALATEQPTSSSDR